MPSPSRGSEIPIARWIRRLGGAGHQLLVGCRDLRETPAQGRAGELAHVGVPIGVPAPRHLPESSPHRIGTRVAGQSQSRKGALARRLQVGCGFPGAGPRVALAAPAVEKIVRLERLGALGGVPTHDAKADFGAVELK